jgi:hypothetical protein
VASRTLISDELAAFLESGLSITAASRDAELQAEGACAWASRVHPDRAHLTLFLYEKAVTPFLRNLETHPEIAALFDQPTTHRACQVKGVFVSSRRGRAAERAEIERQVDGFRRELEGIGIPRALTVGWKIWPCVAVQVRVTQLYEQTPGPGAGEPLR